MTQTMSQPMYPCHKVWGRAPRRGPLTLRRQPAIASMRLVMIFRILGVSDPGSERPRTDAVKRWTNTQLRPVLREVPV